MNFEGLKWTAYGPNLAEFAARFPLAFDYPSAIRSRTLCSSYPRSSSPIQSARTELCFDSNFVATYNHSQCSRDIGIGFNGIGFWLAAERYRNGIGFAALAERYSGIGCPAATGTVWNGIGNSTLVGGNSACAAQCSTGRLASCPYRYTPASPAAPIPERGYHRASTCRPAQAGHGRDALTCCV